MLGRAKRRFQNRLSGKRACRRACFRIAQSLRECPALARLAPRASRLGEWEVGEGISLLIRGEFLEGQSQAGLQMDSQKLHIPRAAMGSDTFGDTSFDLRQPLGASPCGPTSGCSSSRLPERSVVSISEI